MYLSNEDRNELYNNPYYQTRYCKIVPTSHLRGSAIEFQLIVNDDLDESDTLICRMTSKNDATGIIFFHIENADKRKRSGEATVAIPIGNKQNKKQYEQLRRRIARVCSTIIGPSPRYPMTFCGVTFALTKVAENIYKGDHLKHKETKIILYAALCGILRETSDLSKRGFFYSIVNAISPDIRQCLANLLKTKAPNSVITLAELIQYLPSKWSAVFERECVSWLLDRAQKARLTYYSDYHYNAMAIYQNTKNMLKNCKTVDEKILCLLQQAMMSKTEYQKHCDFKIKKLIQELYNGQFRLGSGYLIYELQNLIQAFLGVDYNPGIVKEQDHKMLTYGTQRFKLTKRGGDKTEEIIARCTERLKAQAKDNNAKKIIPKIKQGLISCVESCNKLTLQDSQAPIFSTELKVKFLVKYLGKNKVKSIMVPKSYWVKVNSARIKLLEETGSWGERYSRGDAHVIEALVERFGSGFEILSKVLVKEKVLLPTITIIDDTLDMLAYEVKMEKLRRHPKYNKIDITSEWFKAANESVCANLRSL